MYVHHSMSSAVEPGKATESPTTGVTDGCEAPCECCELNLGLP